MPYLHAYALAFLELSFVMVVLLLLHHLRRTIGAASWAMAIATVMVFAQLVNAGGLRVVTGLPGMDFHLAPPVFFTPLMAILLVTYIVEGTLETQRLIWAFMLGVAGVWIYLAFLTENQLLTQGYAGHPDIPAGIFQSLVFSTRIYVLASLLSLLVEFLTLPVVYQLLRNRGCRLSVSVSGALIFSQVLDAFCYELVTNYNWTGWWESLRQSFLARSTAMVWVSFLTWSYLKMRRVPNRDPDRLRNPLDIVVAFVGGYGRAKQLQAYVRDWEGRYRVVVESTHDLIFLLDRHGTIIDANPTAVAASGYSLAELGGYTITQLALEVSGGPIPWRQLRPRLEDEPGRETTDDFDGDGGAGGVGGKALAETWSLTCRNGDRLELDVTLSPVRIRGNVSILMVARDVTARRLLEAERADLQAQLIHSQRLEAVGKLAGGIAHDFNNLLHAVSGSLDMLEKRLDDPERSRRLLGTIRSAHERAARLTSDLLGFARGGKYRVEPIDVCRLVEQVSELFRPMLGTRIRYRAVAHPDAMTVRGDLTQLEQVLLNMLINAQHAVGEVESPKIVLRAEPAGRRTPGAKPDELPMRRFIVLRVRDNGSGMDDATRQRIFEPFFTTKEAHGTGMGLAMAYGCVENHQGWIHVESSPGKGTEFFIFLPRAEEDAAPAGEGVEADGPRQEGDGGAVR